MKFKKLIAFAMIGGLVLAQASPIQGAYVKAATTTVKVTSSEEDKQDQKLNDILVKVKSVITVPSDFTVFNYSYNSYSTTPTWYLYWSTKDGNNYMSVVSDDSGHVLNYYTYKNNSESTSPQYLQSELKGKAETFLKKVVKAEYNKLSYQSASYIGYANYYSYMYERTENGIAVPDNNMVVTVDSSTGEVKEFTSNWDYTVTFPSSKVSITKEKATELLKKQLTMELEYHEVYSSDGSKMRGELVYGPSKSYLAVDAKNGTVYDARDYYYGNEEGGYGANKTAATESQDSVAYDTAILTEEEIKKVQEMADLLTKTEAIKALKSNSSFLIDSKATTQTANLSQVSLDPSNPDQKSYVWNISLRDESEIDYSSGFYYRAYSSATVDAKSGKVISFNANTREYTNEKDASSAVKLSESEGLKKAETFLKKYYSSMYDQTKYTDSSDGYVIIYKEDANVRGGKIYTFTRVSNGVKFPSNQISVGVDLASGKIYSFDYNWYNKVQFESAQNTITAEAALERYLALDGYDLVYEISTQHKKDNTSTSSVRLVYRTDIQPQYIDAFNGEQVDYSGEKSVKETGYSYTDIEQSAYKRAILILADMGIGFNSSTFSPENAITKEEFNQLMQLVNAYELRNATWSGAGTITREEAAKYAIETLDLGYIAKMDIFKVSYSDSSEIASGNVGYVVLADQLKLLQSGNDTTFRPRQTLTRGEAAQLILQMINMYQY